LTSGGFPRYLLLMANRIIAHKRVLAALTGACVALVTSIAIAALSFSGVWRGLEIFAIVAPPTGAVVGLLLGAGIKASPAPFPSNRVLVAGLIAVPVGAVMMAAALAGPAWLTRPLDAVSQTLVYALIGVVIYGWFVVLLTLPSAMAGAALMQRLLAQWGTPEMPPAADLRGAAA
jgi:hypothetical protein